jgi:hypothetical protein
VDFGLNQWFSTFLGFMDTPLKSVWMGKGESMHPRITAASRDSKNHMMNIDRSWLTTYSATKTCNFLKCCRQYKTELQKLFYL